MNPLSISGAKPTAGHLLAVSPLNNHRGSFARSFSSLAFGCSRQPLPPSSLPPIRASSLNPIHGNPNKSLKLHRVQIFNENSTPEMPWIQFSGPLKAGLVTTVTAAALFLARFCFPLKPSIAAPISTPSTTMQDSVSEEEKEKFVEEQMLSNPYDVDGLKSLMEIKIKRQKFPEAIEILDKLIDLEPDQTEWLLMKSHLYGHIGDVQSAKNGFNELLKKDPCRVEAYHGLATIASSEEESMGDLVDVEKMVEEAMKLCKKQTKKNELRDFKLLIAQIKVLQSRYDDALKVYQELVNEEPRDFRPYLCQGIIYTLLRKNNEAEQNFQKYKRLVPKEHPFVSYFDDNMIATKIFAQKMENERAMAKNWAN